MRRIIQRTVTVVTTTIWKISWQEDALAPDPQADPDMDDFTRPDVSQEMVHYRQKFPPVPEAKEVGLLVAEPEMNQTADEPPDDPNFYEIEKGNEKQ